MPLVTFLISNTEAFGGAGRVLGDLLRDLKQLPARFQMLPTASDSVGRCEGQLACGTAGSAKVTCWGTPGVGLTAQRFCDSRSFAFERTAGPGCPIHLSRNSANRKRLSSSPAHWQEKYNEANDVSPPDSTTVNSVRLMCADSTLDVCSR